MVSPTVLGTCQPLCFSPRRTGPARGRGRTRRGHCQASRAGPACVCTWLGGLWERRASVWQGRDAAGSEGPESPPEPPRAWVWPRRVSQERLLGRLPCVSPLGQERRGWDYGTSRVTAVLASLLMAGGSPGRSGTRPLLRAGLGARSSAAGHLGQRVTSLGGLGAGAGIWHGAVSVGQAGRCQELGTGSRAAGSSLVQRGPRRLVGDPVGCGTWHFVPLPFTLPVPCLPRQVWGWGSCFSHQCQQLCHLGPSLKHSPVSPALGAGGTGEASGEAQGPLAALQH